jgi:hypothetical protein
MLPVVARCPASTPDRTFRRQHHLSTPRGSACNACILCREACSCLFFPRSIDVPPGGCEGRLRNRVGSCILLVSRSGYEEEEDEISSVILRGIDSPRKHIPTQAHSHNCNQDARKLSGVFTKASCAAMEATQATCTSEKFGWPSADAIMACRKMGRHHSQGLPRRVSGSERAEELQQFAPLLGS